MTGFDECIFQFLKRYSPHKRLRMTLFYKCELNVCGGHFFSRYPNRTVHKLKRVCLSQRGEYEGTGIVGPPVQDDGDEIRPTLSREIIMEIDDDGNIANDLIRVY